MYPKYMDFQLTSKYTPAEHIGYMGSYVTTTRSLTRSTVALLLPQPWTPYIPADPYSGTALPSPTPGGSGRPPAGRISNTVLSLDSHPGPHADPINWQVLLLPAELKNKLIMKMTTRLETRSEWNTRLSHLNKESYASLLSHNLAMVWGLTRLLCKAALLPRAKLVTCQEQGRALTSKLSLLMFSRAISGDGTQPLRAAG